MNKESYELFENGEMETILERLDNELKSRNESAFWTLKVVPFSRAILSVLIPLRDSNMLFTPEGKHTETLTPELFFEFSDFVSLKTLAFTIQKSNLEGKLTRTKLEDSICENYKDIDLNCLGDYLSSCGVALDKESLDFPISTYNLHQGVSNVIKSLL